MESITMKAKDTQEEITAYVLEETTLKQQKYLLVTEESEGDSEAYILKEVESDDTDVVYEIVEDDVEFDAVLKIFEELVEDTTFEV